MQESEIVDWKAMFEKMKKEKEESEAKRMKMENDAKEAEAKWQKEKEEAEAKWQKEKEESEAKWQKEKEEAEAKLKEKEESEAKLKKEKEEAEAKWKKEKEEAEADREKVSLATLITAPPEVNLEAAGSTSSNVRSSAYMKADINEVPFEFALKLKTNDEIGTRSFELDENLITKLKHCQSGLLWYLCKKMGMEKKLSLSYRSEADISPLIWLALEDATDLAQCITGKTFVIRRDYSIFSLRPDHFVLLVGDVPLLAVEEKKPWNTKKHKEKKMETDLGRAYGQLYDYATMMRAFGTRASFLVLTCFEESQMLWLDSDQSNDIASNKNGIRDNLRPVTSPTTKQDKENTPPALNFKSPDKNVIKTMIDPQVQIGFKSLNNRRVLNASSSFGSTHLVPLLYTAILCALKAIPTEQSKLEIPLFKNEVLKDCNVLKMQSNPRQYEWGSLSAIVGQRIDNQKDCYYVIDIIGMGSTSKVFYALRSDGEPCVIKMFMNRAKKDENGDTSANDDWKEVAKNKTNTEKRNFDILYPFLKDEVKVEMILGFFCVVMPFFTPLKSVEQEESQNKIKQVLKIFHEKNLQYLECDLRWRHIGRYKDEIILYDLADLTVIDNQESNSDAFVDKCWSALQHRLPCDSQSQH